MGRDALDGLTHPADLRRIWTNRKWLDPRAALYNSSKSSAKTRGLEHSISKEDIVIPDVCPVLGLKLKSRGRDPNSMTIDRIDTSKGYVKGNISIISWRANNLKSNGSLDEFEKIVNYMKKELTVG